VTLEVAGVFIRIWLLQMRYALFRFACVIALAAVGLAVPGTGLGIAGGEAISIQDAPWTVAIFRQGYPACTGVILDATRVLTAAHCVWSDPGNVRQPPSQFRIVAGLSNINDAASSPFAQVRSVTAVQVMPGHAQNNVFTDPAHFVEHDLALMTLSRPLTLTGPYIRSAALPRRPVKLRHLMMAGFGETASDDNANDQLKELTAPEFIPACSTSVEICIVSANNSAATCPGDSGGGLVVAGGARPIVIGILSTGSPGCPLNGENTFVDLTTKSAERFLGTFVATGPQGTS
jgi:hypothetical protein